MGTSAACRAPRWSEPVQDRLGLYRFLRRLSEGRHPRQGTRGYAIGWIGDLPDFALGVSPAWFLRMLGITRTTRTLSRPYRTGEELRTRGTWEVRMCDRVSYGSGALSVAV